MTDRESIKAAWDARPQIPLSALQRGVYLAPPAEAWKVSASGQDLVPPVRSIKQHFFRLVHDEVYETVGPHPYLLYRRTRIIGDGVTVEEQLESSADALKRGRYHAV